MRRALIAAAVTALSALPAAAQTAADAVDPEIAVPLPDAFAGLSEPARAAWQAREAGQPVTARNWMVGAANPLAVEAGAEVLRAGGTAADAMVAVQAVLGLVEPQSSGLGGGAFLVWYDAATGTVTTLDGRETAPLAATPRLFQTEDGEPLPFWDAVVGGLSVGTPGTPALMEAAHRRWGHANWAGLFDPAITLAEEGFAISPRLAGQIAADRDRLTRFPATAAYFYPGGEALAAGDIRTNPAYADTLRILAAQGAAGFYTGPVAEDIVATVRMAEGNPGLLGLTDLATYRIVERPAVCIDYRGAEVCGMGPPSSGAIAVAQILGKLSHFDLPGMDPDAAETWRLIGDATRLAFADRGRFVADSDFVPVPVQGLIAPDYLAERADLLRTDAALAQVAPGTPEWDHALNWASDTDPERPATSHISIVDSFGNALSMTTTIESGFGARLFVRGFLLNNELTDFSFRSHDGGWPIANRVEPGKRPRSSMSPTIVLREGAPVVVTGSPGGAPIISYTANSLIAHLDWGLDPQAAIDRPHLVNAFGTYILEADTAAEALVAPLTELGFTVNTGARPSGLHMIAIGPDGLTGGADRRREGIALGE